MLYLFIHIYGCCVMEQACVQSLEHAIFVTVYSYYFGGVKLCGIQSEPRWKKEACNWNHSLLAVISYDFLNLNLKQF